MTHKRISVHALLAVTITLTLLATGCRKADTESPAEQGAWAQVPDILAHIAEPNIPNRVFDITQYGAVSDGQTDCYKAFTDAVAACEAADGGQVLVPAGTYLVKGPIHFASNMDLHLADGAHVKFAGKFTDYLPLAMTRWQGTRVYNYSPFIYAYRKHNIALTGTGTLDGQAQETWSTWTDKEADGAATALRMNEEGNSVIDRFLGDGHFLRPSMIQFMGCDGVLVDGIKIVNSPFWCLHPVFAQRLTIRNVRFDAQNPDNDGIALDSCAYVNVHDTTFSNQGAGVTIISGLGREGRELNRPSRNIYVHDCTFNAQPAVAITDQTAGGIYNVFVEDGQTESGTGPVLTIADAATQDGEVVHTFQRGVSEPNAVNLPPDVYAGPDVELPAGGGTVSLTGSVSDDGRPAGKLVYEWSVLQGDATAVKIAEATALKTQATVSKDGIYILKLDVGDGEASGHHFTMIKAGEQPDGMEGVTKPIFPTP